MMNAWRSLDMRMKDCNKLLILMTQMVNLCLVTELHS